MVEGRFISVQAVEEGWMLVSIRVCILGLGACGCCMEWGVCVWF
jgi:hypothetical protein